MRYGSLGRPLAHGLLEEGDGRNQVEHAPADAGGSLRNAKRGERLAGAAGHDELAAVVFGEAGGHVVGCGSLVRPEAEGLAPVREPFGLLVYKVGPVERSARKVSEAKHRAGGLEPFDGLPRVRSPLVAGVDDEVRGERLSGRGGDKGVEVRLRDPCARRVALALDGAVPALALGGDEVDAGVVAVEAGLQCGPLGPQPRVGEPVLVDRILFEVPLHQAFKESPFLGFRAGNGSDVVQHALKAVGHSPVLVGWIDVRSFLLSYIGPSVRVGVYAGWRGGPSGVSGVRRLLRAGSCHLVAAVGSVGSDCRSCGSGETR